MRYEFFIRDSFGNDLEVIQDIPTKGSQFPTIILVPGFGVDLHEYGFFDEISAILVKYGFGTIRFSFEGTGKSQGNFVTTTTSRQIRQLHTIIEFVLNDRYTDKQRIGIFAHSFGGAVVIASLPLEMIHTFVLASVPTTPKISLEKYFRAEWGYDPERISRRKRSDKSVTKIGPEFWQELEKYNFIEDIQKITQPTLLLYGERDSKFNAQHGQIYFEKLKGRKKFLMLEKADHSFTRAYRTEALKLIAMWFEEILLESV